MNTDIYAVIGHNIWEDSRDRQFNGIGILVIDKSSAMVNEIG